MIWSGPLTHSERTLSQTGVDGEQEILPSFDEDPAYVARRRGTAKGIANAAACAMRAIVFKEAVIDALLDPGYRVGRDTLYARKGQVTEGFETKLWMMKTNGMSWESPWRCARSTR